MNTPQSSKEAKPGLCQSPWCPRQTNPDEPCGLENTLQRVPPPDKDHVILFANGCPLKTLEDLIKKYGTQFPYLEKILANRKLKTS